jgi:hypothetical protein
MTWPIPPAETDIADFTNDRGDTVKSIPPRREGDDQPGHLSDHHLPRPEPSRTRPGHRRKGWNGKLFWRFGASASVSRYQTATSGATAAINENALRRGFMLAASSLTDHGTNSNDTLGRRDRDDAEGADHRDVRGDPLHDE